MDLTNTESDNHEKLEQLSRMTSESYAAILLSDSLKIELRFLQDELKSQKNLNIQNFNVQKHLANKLNEVEDEVFSLKKKCNLLKEDIRLKEINIKQLESQLGNTVSQKQALDQRMHEMSQLLSLAEEEKLSTAIHAESIKETNDRLWLVEKENEVLKKANDALTTENNSFKLIENQFLRDNENDTKLQAQTEERALMLIESEKEYKILKESLEESKKMEVRLLSEELEMEKRLRIENEAVLQETLDDFEQTKLQLEIFQNDSKIDVTTSVAKENVPSSETLAVKNNYQFFVENIDSSRLINVLRGKDCITDEERDHLINQPGSFYRNSELLHWMRNVKFKRDKGVKVLSCFSKTRQDFIADLLKKDGVVVQCNISSKLVSKFPVNLSKKLTREQAPTLKEKEASMTLKLNQTQSKPSSGSGLKTISELFDDEIEIAPYSRRDENGIVVWFWCHSQNSLLRLQGMYVSGELLERTITLFKQLSITEFSTPSTVDALVPHTVTIQAEAFLKTMKIVDYKQEPTLLRKIRTKAAETNKARLCGMTILVDEVFVVNEGSSFVEVYDLTSLEFKRSFSTDDLQEPKDLVSCSMKNVLYIVDSGHYVERSNAMKILRVDANGQCCKKLWQGDDWGRLSVTNDFNILLAVKEKHKLLEITSDGQLIREIHVKLPVTTLWHAIKLTGGNFLVSYGNPGGLCIVDTEGKLIIRHENYYKELDYAIIIPIKLALDKAGSVLVADAKGDSVLLLTPTLEFQRELVSAKHGLQIPRTILLDDLNGRLLVGENASRTGRHIGRISVFDIGGANALQE